MNYHIWTLDVWGNNDDGYWVNDRSNVGHIDLPDEATDAHIIFRLQEEGIIINSQEAKLEDFWPDFDVIIDGKPTLTLESTEDY